MLKMNKFCNWSKNVEIFNLLILLRESSDFIYRILSVLKLFVIFIELSIALNMGNHLLIYFFQLDKSPYLNLSCMVEHIDGTFHFPALETTFSRYYIIYSRDLNVNQFWSNPATSKKKEGTRRRRRKKEASYGGGETFLPLPPKRGCSRSVCHLLER